jgi:plasmid maintenance system antidote protein VapI
MLSSSRDGATGNDPRFDRSPPIQTFKLIPFVSGIGIGVQMPSKPNKSKKSLKQKRQSYKPKSVQNRVIELCMKGESIRKIAQKLDIDRKTVARILTISEISSEMAKQQSRLLGMGNKAIDVMEEALDYEDRKVAFANAPKLLEGIGVLNGQGLPSLIKTLNDLEFDADDDRDDDDDDDDDDEKIKWPPKLIEIFEPKITRKKPPKAES